MIEKIQIHNGKGKLERIQNRNLTDSEDILQKVQEILEEVKLKGDKAVIEFTNTYDKNHLKDLRVEKEEIEEAKRNIDKDLEKAIKRAINNINRFHKEQVEKDFIKDYGNGVILGQLINPIERVGIYVPGGTASYPSTVMMNVIPANIGGVKEIVITTPANENGKVKDSVLVTANLLRVKEIYKIGGAQAIGALCYGTGTIRKVDKIVGPGNIYVAMAKREVSGLVGIDAIAGPSEVVILADKDANPKFIAADLLAQAEHDTRAACIVVTDCNSLGDRILKEIDTQISKLQRSRIVEKSLKDYGAIIVTNNMTESFNIVNSLAPEHLEILTNNPLEDSKKIRNAGAIFIGEYSPEAVGDYYAGPNHTLPTSRTARFSSALGVYDFIKKTSLIYYSEDALKRAAQDIRLIAEDEGLTGHANSVKIRTEDKDV